MISEDDESHLVSLAILQVNWDRQGRSHLDNFIPFALESMRRTGGVDFSDLEVRSAVLTHFGIELPTTVAGSVMKRAAVRGLGRIRNRKFEPDPSRLSGSGVLAEQQEAFRRVQRNLVASLIEHASVSFSISWDEDDATRRLLAYVDMNAPQLLRTALRGGVLPQSEVAGRESVVVASWIRNINERDPERFEHLLTIVKGSMLAASLFSTGPGELERPFRSTRLLLDTPVILEALGYEGADRELAAKEALDLARSQGAKLVCLVPTLKEVRGVMASAAEIIRNPRARERLRPVQPYFLHSGHSYSDIVILAERLELDLGRIRVDIEDSPEHVHHLAVDEDALENALQAAVGYAREATLRHDLDLLTAAHRIRGRSAGDKLETCRALVITTNDSVVATARSFADFRCHRPPLAMQLAALGTILWAKKPLASPDLPRHQLLANCYAALAPSSHLWHQYVDEIDRLRDRGRIHDDDVSLLRYHQEAGERLVEESVRREGGGVDEEMVLAVLERVQSELREPFEQQLELMQLSTGEALETASRSSEQLDRFRSDAERRDSLREEEIRELQGRIAALQVDRERVVRRVATRSRRLGEAVQWAIVLIVIAVPLVAFVYGGLWVVGFVASLILGLGSVYGNWKEPAERVGDSVARALARRSLRRLGFGANDEDLEQPTSARASG